MSVFCDMQWLEFCRGGLWALGWFFCYVCLQGGFWLQIHASFCHGSKASVFPSNCWELGWRDLICHCWSKRLKCHQNEIKSDQIELELCLHTLLPFSSSLPVLFSLVLIPPPPLHLPPTSPLLSILWHRLFITCRNDLLMPSGKFTQPYLHLSCGLQRKCNPPACTFQKTQVDNLWCFRFCWEPPRVKQMSCLLSFTFFFPFSCCSPEGLIW